ncbi:isoleucyl-tRNA synthetase, partial [candidate division MSBL1 archaeon SCGC-AAA382F02]
MIQKAPKKYDATEKEEEIQEWWESENIHPKVKQTHEEDPDWYFLDGPPYASGKIHLGTAWNKLIKDTVLRFKTMQGFNVRKQPGWDCHGLPIEVKVEEKLNIESKKDIEEKIGIKKFIDECKSWAMEHVDIMSEQFQRLGIWMDWDDPYLTLKNDYLESAWWTLKKAHERGLMEKRLQVIQWCPRCETALAEHEIRGEYRQVKDPSLYARFKLTYTSNEYLLVWTTTPWTIPANVAISVHPDLYYAKVEVGENTYIMAEALVSKVMSELGIYDYKRVDLIKGEELEGLRYEHPLLEEVPKQNDFKSEHRVITGEHVTIEEGTGCVHTAPGHGEEDFEIGKEY